MYRGIVTLSNVIDSTSSGNNDTSDQSLTLGTLETLTFVWSGGTPGADAYASIYGTLDTGRG